MAVSRWCGWVDEQVGERVVHGGRLAVGHGGWRRCCCFRVPLSLCSRRPEFTVHAICCLPHKKVVEGGWFSVGGDGVVESGWCRKGELQDVVDSGARAVVDLEVTYQPVGKWIGKDVIPPGGLFGAGGNASVVVVGLAPLGGIATNIKEQTLLHGL